MKWCFFHSSSYSIFCVILLHVASTFFCIFFLSLCLSSYNNFMLSVPNLCNFFYFFFGCEICKNDNWIFFYSIVVSLSFFLCVCFIRNGCYWIDWHSYSYTHIFKKKVLNNNNSININQSMQFSKKEFKIIIWLWLYFTAHTLSNIMPKVIKLKWNYYYYYEQRNRTRICTQ